MKDAKIKLVIWDLDNTIWKGILIENDVLQPSPEMLNIIKTLDERGILQSIASKNNYGLAMERLRELQIEQYFLHPQINWETKSKNIQKIIETLNISNDTVAFVDDQAFERDEVSYHIQGITCIDALEASTLLEREDMNPDFITVDSKVRRQMYQSDVIRNQLEEAFEGTSEEFLETLNMVLTIKPADIDDLMRVEELTVRTHQLNSTGYIYPYDELKSLIHDDSYMLLIADLTDRYGTYGKIGLILLENQQDRWTLKLLLTSCRVMSRGIGSAILRLIINMAIEENISLYAEFVPTDRNRMMDLTYAMHDFKPQGIYNYVHTLKCIHTEPYALPSYLDIRNAIKK